MSNLPNSASGGVPVRNQQTPLPNQPISMGGPHKEIEAGARPPESLVEEIGTELELTPELEQIGIRKQSETIELPPDMRQMGVSAPGSQQPLPKTATIQLPLTDEQLVQGANVQLKYSWRWLREWCVMKLRKAHVTLKMVAGKVVRIQS